MNKMAEYLAVMFSAVLMVVSPAHALVIDQILLLTNVQNPDDKQVKDLTNSVTDGKKFDFDMHTYFPSFFPQVGEGTGFIFLDENASFGLLTKGLDVKANAAGQVRNAELDIFAHWDHPAGNVTQQIEVAGTLTVSPPNGVAAVKYDDELHPFLTDPPNGPVQNGNGTALDQVGSAPVSDGLGPATMFLAAGRIDYKDILQVGAQDFAESDFLGTSTEISTIAEPGTPLMLCMSWIVVILLSSLGKLPPASRTS